MTSENKKEEEKAIPATDKQTGDSEENLTTDKPSELIEISKSELDAMQQNIEDYKSKYIRALADLENYKKRSEQENENTSKYAVSKFAKELLPLLNIFQKALSGVEEKELDNEFKNFVVGIKLTKQEFENTLTKFGIKKIEALGNKFNANLHEALFSREDKEKEEGIIIEVIEEGYTIADRLLKPSKVGIIKNEK